MTQTQTRPRPAERSLSDTDSPYTTDRDWWYDDLDADDSTPDRGHDELAGTTRAEYVAHTILKRGADLLDPISLNEDAAPADLHDEGERVPVSEPSEYVPKRHDGSTFAAQDYNAHDKRWRVSEKYGYLVRGPIIADRPTDEFLDHVRGALDAAEAWCDRTLPQRERTAIVDRAERMKVGGAHDVTAMAEVVRCIDSPGRALDDDN
ncbi:hypothetical protein [Halostella litorea]|uniref:hypothetical protein n=1 Tax=Halostella litorea TaxID=2528831 RepID=UPI0010923907|nr:hypothetical protein [Halostella litorea]